MPVPTHVKHPSEAKLVLFQDMQDFISEAFDKQYDLYKGFGGSAYPGERFVLDLRVSAPSEPGMLAIEDWREREDEQPNAQVALSHLVATRLMDDGVYVVAVPV